MGAKARQLAITPRLPNFRRPECFNTRKYHWLQSNEWSNQRTIQGAAAAIGHTNADVGQPTSTQLASLRSQREERRSRAVSKLPIFVSALSSSRPPMCCYHSLTARLPTGCMFTTMALHQLPTLVPPFVSLATRNEKRDPGSKSQTGSPPWPFPL